MDAFSIFIQYTPVSLGEIHSKRRLRPIFGLICKLSMLSKCNRYNIMGIVCMQLHPTTLRIELVVSLLCRKTAGKNLEVDLIVLGFVTALDTVSIQ